MNKARLSQLLTFLEEDNKDPFNWYAVGNEYRTEEPLKAVEYFEELRTRFPAYVPTYYILAETLVVLEEMERAKEVYERGIAVAKEAGEQKALAELQNAYQNFLFELD